MADKAPVKLTPVPIQFPPANLPTIFAEAVLNVAPGNNVVKFYLARVDPATSGENEYQMQLVGQVVMPTLSFVQTALFFNKNLEALLRAGTISAEQIEQAKRSLDEPQPESSAMPVAE